MPALLEIIPKYSYNVQSKSSSNVPKLNMSGGHRISKQTRVERLRAHAETQEVLAKRRESMATLELELQRRALEKNERFELQQLMQQMKQVRAEENATRPVLKRDPLAFLAHPVQGARRNQRSSSVYSKARMDNLFTRSQLWPKQPFDLAPKECFLPSVGFEFTTSHTPDKQS